MLSIIMLFTVNFNVNPILFLMYEIMHAVSVKYKVSNWGPFCHLICSNVYSILFLMYEIMHAVSVKYKVSNLGPFCHIVHHTVIAD